MNSYTDILQPIPDEELQELRDFYKEFPRAPYVHTFLLTAIDWKIKSPNKDYIKFYSPNGNWRSNGTFLALLDVSPVKTVFVFTKEISCDELYITVVKQKLIDLVRGPTLFFCVCSLHVQRINDAIKTIGMPVYFQGEFILFWMPKEKASNLQFNVPNDVYIKKIEADHIPLVNKLWPHRYPGSELYLETLAKMSGGYGLFLKENDALVSWIFKNNIGILAVLQTVEEYKRRGFGTLMTKFLSKLLAEEGIDPMATVYVQNTASIAMMKKVGFESIDKIVYIDGGELHHKK